eukprot:UN21790
MSHLNFKRNLEFCVEKSISIIYSFEKLLKTMIH